MYILYVCTIDVQIMEELFDKSERRLKLVDLNFKRYLFPDVDDKERLIGITGARGTGKTTLLMQKLKEKNVPANKAFYASMDDIYFSTHRLVDVAAEFSKNGGKYLFLDEVHKYETWSIELKNIYDTYPELNVMFTGSSVIEMAKTQGDLSRRAMVYKLESMSFREYLAYDLKLHFDPIPLADLLSNHIAIAESLLDKGLEPLKHLEYFHKYGAYPYSLESKNTFHEKLRNTINVIIENDLAAAAGIDFSTGLKIKKMLAAISQSVPFKPNMNDLAAKIGADRRNVYKYLDYLKRSRLINTLTSDEKNYNAMSKPEMIYLENGSLAYALCEEKPEKGMLRETFVYSQMNPKHHVSYTPAGDFLIDNKYIFEVGGKNKKFKQIKNLPASHLAIDEIEVGHGNKIPMWMLGFLR